MKKIIFTKHANERLHSRDVTLKELNYALNHCDNIQLSIKGRIKKIIANIPDKGFLTVVCKEYKKKFVIITTYWGGK